ncbi:MAG TPA: ribbon-helix-helix protein, CopG family [Verrucomicrobiae bacterium]|jgi:hypothetical protein|nr:ribbon-helix-helix protein, CopG family [Verrucomicrobiae bacterium]
MPRCEHPEFSVSGLFLENRLLFLFLAAYETQLRSEVFLRVDLLAQREYPFLMETVTLKMNRKQIALLREQAKTLGRSQAAIMRDLIEQHLAPKKRPSLYERAKDLCGSVRGPKNLSTRPLTGYGRD